jgi:hypothetical protein
MPYAIAAAFMFVRRMVSVIIILFLTDTDKIVIAASKFKMGVRKVRVFYV